jgi:hypothetical protein
MGVETRMPPTEQGNRFKCLRMRKDYSHHDRVGYARRVKVSHPAAPEYTEALKTHMSW